MQIEHITLGGNSVIRDTSVVLMETLNILSDFKISEGSVELPFPMTSFKVKVTATDEGAMFDIRKGQEIVTTNVCCFQVSQRDGLIEHVQQLSKMFGVDIVIQPKLDQFIYTILINPFAATHEEIQIAGEIELYIYYTLFLARQTT